MFGVKSRVRIIGGSTRFYHSTRTARTTKMDSRSERVHTGQLCSACQKINRFRIFQRTLNRTVFCKTTKDIKSTCLDCELCFLIWNGWKVVAMEEYEMNNESLFSTPDSDTGNEDRDSSDKKIEPALAKVALEPIYIQIMECGNGKGTNMWLDRSPRLYAGCGLEFGSETIPKC